MSIFAGGPPTPGEVQTGFNIVKTLFGGGSNALPEIQVGFRHREIDQTRLANDPYYKEAAIQLEAEHRAQFGVTWTEYNANGDGSFGIAPQIETRAARLKASAEKNQASAGAVSNVAQFSRESPAPTFRSETISELLSAFASPFAIMAMIVLIAIFFLKRN